MHEASYVCLLPDGGGGAPRSVRLLDSVGPTVRPISTVDPGRGSLSGLGVGEVRISLCGAETGGELVRACVAGGSWGGMG